MNKKKLKKEIKASHTTTTTAVATTAIVTKTTSERHPNKRSRERPNVVDHPPLAADDQPAICA